MASGQSKVRGKLVRISGDLQESFKAERRVMSFAEYLELAEKTPKRQLRSSPQFLRDCFDYYGTSSVRYPWGEARRFRLFDCEWDEGKDPLLGQEEVQNQVYRALSNLVNEGAANKLILLHGPNGSAKSTFVRCVGRALEHYSHLEEGAVYRFNWILPKQKLGRGDIGFSKQVDEKGLESFAYLVDDDIDAKLSDELRDHPLLLLPMDVRQELLSEWLGRGDAESGRSEEGFVVCDYLRQGRLSHRNKAIYEALLTNYHGDYLKVLRHVQVERFFVSHRYREGYVTVEPQLHVDAHERQITQDSSIAALPPALQSLTLYRYGGELVTANRGLIEFSDLLKRPMEAFKYLLTTVEQGSVSLPNASLFLDLSFLGTSNEIHLSAFKEIAEFQSFRGRLELVRVGYLLDVAQEELIYDVKLKEAARSKHIAPHCAYVAALWAVMTRMRKPEPEGVSSAVAELATSLGPLQKAELYAYGRAPKGLSNKESKELVGGIAELREQGQDRALYEGLTGASPREIQSVLFNAANAEGYNYVSPLVILDEIAELCKRTSVYEFLRQEAQAGGFFDHKGFIGEVRARLLDRIDDEFRAAMGLVEEEEYRRVFTQYIHHVTAFTKGEKIRNLQTGAMETADEKLMGSVESTLGMSGSAREFRGGLISRIGAWALENRGQEPSYEEIFADYFETLREEYYGEHRKAITSAMEHFSELFEDEGTGLRQEDRREAEAILERLCKESGYNRSSARDLVQALRRERYRD